MKRNAERRLKALEALQQSMGMRGAFNHEEARIIVEDPQAAELAHVWLETLVKGLDASGVEERLYARLRAIGYADA